VKIAILGDAHLIAENDPYKNLHKERSFFKGTWPSFSNILQKVNDESPDMTIFLGDLVDWFSHENIDFALDLLSKLSSPWFMTPGNHDFEKPVDGFKQERYAVSASRDHIDYWQSKNIDFSNKVFDLDYATLILMDNALSDIYKNSDAWLNKSIHENGKNILLTHVPIDTPITRQYIKSVDKNRNLKKYVMSGAPKLYSEVLKNRINHMFSAHLHFGGELNLDSTEIHMANMSISIEKLKKERSVSAEAYILEGTKKELKVKKIMI
jgi:predicted MPP superfamily phosphohydrolase